MLDIDILEIGRAVSFGSATIESIQNRTEPELDLLVREAIQNSSDASIKEDSDKCIVKFNTGNFDSVRFNKFLIEAEKDERHGIYPESEAPMYLEIRDTGTSGLTGPTRVDEIERNDDDHGNFFRLIFDTGVNQTKEHAGGNWGLGKSVYYRVGKGIVVYYSRIKTECDSYEERLIITLVEDEKKKDAGRKTAIFSGVRRYAGKVWWGVKAEKDFLPVTDETVIEDILDVFKIDRFKPHETGTSVIIPYIDPDKLLKKAIPADDDNTDKDVIHYVKNVLANDLETYLRYAVQKWYAPRLYNSNIVNFSDELKPLEVYVNGDCVGSDTDTDMFPFFKLVREMYTAALAKVYKFEDYKPEIYPQIQVEEVKVKKYFASTSVGYVSVIKIKRNEIDKYSESPNVYIGNYECNTNDPIVMYARDLGMVIKYETTSDWTHGVSKPIEPDEYLLAFFVPDTHLKIRDEYEEYGGLTLGEYLRKCEKSDHMGWTNIGNMPVIWRIQEGIKKYLRQLIQTNTIQNNETTETGFANLLGTRLNLKFGYGKGGRGGEPSGGSSKIRPVFSIVSQSLDGDNLLIEFTLKVLQNIPAFIYVAIASEAGTVNEASWSKEIGSAFPVGIVKLYTRKIETDSEIINVDTVCDENNKNAFVPELSSELISVSDGSAYTAIKYVSIVGDATITGAITLHSADRTLSLDFSTEYKEVL